MVRRNVYSSKVKSAVHSLERLGRQEVPSTHGVAESRNHSCPRSLRLKLPYEDRLSYQSHLFLIQQKLHTLMLCSKPLILSKVKREATQKKAAQEQVIFFSDS